MVAGMDEVGRGSLAGPVCVGVALLLLPGFQFFRGSLIRRCSVFAREALYEPVFQWSPCIEIGQASVLRSIVVRLSPRFDLPDGVL